MTDTQLSPRGEVLLAIANERNQQERKWGEQNHQDSAGPNSRREARQRAKDWQDENACRVSDGTLTWDGILLEEVYEALAEEDHVKLRAELVQVAAVAANWIEAIDRRPAVSL